MNAMQVRFNKISAADFRGKSSNKPWKPEVTLQEGEEDPIEVEEVDNLTICSEMTEMGMVLLEIKNKAKDILEVYYVVKVEEEVGLTKVQMLDVQELPVNQWTKIR